MQIGGSTSIASWIAVHRLAHPFYFFSHLILLSVMHVSYGYLYTICIQSVYSLYTICVQSVYNLYTVCVMTNPIKQQQNLGLFSQAGGSWGYLERHSRMYNLSSTCFTVCSVVPKLSKNYGNLDKCRGLIRWICPQLPHRYRYTWAASCSCGGWDWSSTLPVLTLMLLLYWPLLGRWPVLTLNLPKCAGS